MTKPGADPPLAQQMIAREMAKREGQGEALNMMIRSMVPILRSGRSGISHFATHL
jgi:hypothetical protein